MLSKPVYKNIVCSDSRNAMLNITETSRYWSTAKNIATVYPMNKTKCASKQLLPKLLKRQIENTHNITI